MEFTNIEVSRVEELSHQAAEQQMHELNDLQLALIGGGGGEVIFF
ncbi:MAG: hypothetical protein ABIQ72_05725 [Usitatibacter sp.]